MGIFDIFTGDSAKEASEQSRALYNQSKTNIGNRTNTAAQAASGYYNAGYDEARGNLDTGYNRAVSDINALNNSQGGSIGQIDYGVNLALGSLGQARNDLTANGGAYAPLTALAQQYGQGANAYADALGLNGTEGNARAVAAYQKGPGYEAGLNQGIDAISRLANASGAYVGGNTVEAARKYGQDYQNQDYSNYLNRLSAYNNLALSATQGASAGNQDINKSLAQLGVTGAGYLNNAGTNKAQIYNQMGNTLSSLASQYYGNRANLGTSQGNTLAGNAWNVANALNAADLNIDPKVSQTYTDWANADTNASKNIWSAGLNLAKLGASLF